MFRCIVRLFQKVQTKRLQAILVCLFIIYESVHVFLFVCFRSVGGKKEGCGRGSGEVLHPSDDL